MEPQKDLLMEPQKNKFKSSDTVVNNNKDPIHISIINIWSKQFVTKCQTLKKLLMHSTGSISMDEPALDVKIQNFERTTPPTTGDGVSTEPVAVNA